MVRWRDRTCRLGPVGNRRRTSGAVGAGRFVRCLPVRRHCGSRYGQGRVTPRTLQLQPRRVRRHTEHLAALLARKANGHD